MRTGPIPPLVVDSGGGMQFFWRLPDKLDVERHATEARAHSRGIAKAIDGDAVHDIARVMRLPGTINIPGAKKLARGRERALAVRYAVDDKAFRLADLARVYPPVFSTETKDNDADIERVRSSLDMTAIGSTLSVSDLGKDVCARFEALLSSDPRFRRLWDGDPDVLGKDKSGSAYRAALAVELNRAGGFTAESFGRLLHLWDHSVAAGADAHETITDRMIARDWVRIGLPKSADTWLQPIFDDAPGAPMSAVVAKRLWVVITAQECASTALAASGRPLIKGLLEEGAMTILYGESNVGKTFVAFDIAFHVATGLQWAGMRTSRRSVIYVAAEGGRGAGKRCAAIKQKLGPAFDTAWLSLRTETVDLLSPSADLEPLIAAALASCEPVGLIVIDTLSRAMAGGDENASTDMGTLVNHIDRIRIATGAHVMAVHHSGKDRAKGARGHSLLRAATDTEIEIVPNELIVTKQRDLETTFRTAFSLEGVVIGTDADGDPIKSCVVRLDAENPPQQIAATPAEQIVLDQLETLAAAASDRRGTPVKEILEAMEDAGHPTKREIVRSQLNRMLKKRLVRMINPGFWAPEAKRFGLLKSIKRNSIVEGRAKQTETESDEDVFD